MLPTNHEQLRRYNHNYYYYTVERRVNQQENTSKKFGLKVVQRKFWFMKKVVLSVIEKLLNFFSKINFLSLFDRDGGVNIIQGGKYNRRVRQNMLKSNMNLLRDFMLSNYFVYTSGVAGKTCPCEILNGALNNHFFMYFYLLVFIFQLKTKAN